MSFCLRPNNCKKCGKPLTLFEGWTCLECERAESRSDTETVNPYLKKEMHDLMNQPIVPTDELKRIIGYQEVIPTTYRESEE